MSTISFPPRFYSVCFLRANVTSKKPVFKWDLYFLLMNFVSTKNFLLTKYTTNFELCFFSISFSWGNIFYSVYICTFACINLDCEWSMYGLYVKAICVKYAHIQQCLLSSVSSLFSGWCYYVIKRGLFLKRDTKHAFIHYMHKLLSTYNYKNFECDLKC